MVEQHEGLDHATITYLDSVIKEWGGAHRRALPTLSELFARYEIDAREPQDLGAPLECSRTEMFEALAERPLLEAAFGVEIGSPGVPMMSGRVLSEPNWRYRPFAVRGSGGNAGLYEQHWRSEPIIFDAVQTHTETLVCGTWELQAPELPTKAQRARVERWITFHEAKLEQLAEPFERFITDAASFLIHGFVPFEVVWGYDSATGWIYPAKLAWRSPATVERWIYDGYQRTLLGAEFMTSGSGARRYVLPATGPALWHRKLLLVNVHSYGNNPEGVSPQRPTLHWKRFKDLLAKIGPLSAELYGVPIATVEEDAAYLDSLPDDARKKVRAALAVIVAMRALDGPRFSIPRGLRFTLHSPAGVAPTHEGMLNYCDRMIAQPYSNEGSLLGLQQAVGSYALGEVKERKTLASAPFYAGRIAAALNELYRPLALAQLGPMPRLPRWRWRMSGLHDSSRWLTDAVSLFGNDLDRWPEEAVRSAIERLELPAEAADEVLARRLAAQAADVVSDLGTTDGGEE